MSGGEGEIRTPDSLATMSDFESGAFNRALPPLRCIYLNGFTVCLQRVGLSLYWRGFGAGAGDNVENLSKT